MSIHFHRYEPVKVENTGWFTVILERCRICGYCTSRRIRGTWTLEDIKGEKPKCDGVVKGEVS